MGENRRRTQQTRFREYYLVDGHNLIGCGWLPGLSLGTPDAEAKLVLHLKGFAAPASILTGVVFDRGLPAGRSSLSTWDVLVFFAAQCSSADRVLCKAMKNLRDHCGRYTLVSTDQEVCIFAQARGFRTMRSQEFALVIQGGAGASPGPVPPVPHEERNNLLRAFGEGWGTGVRRCVRRRR